LIIYHVYYSSMLFPHKNEWLCEKNLVNSWLKVKNIKVFRTIYNQLNYIAHINNNLIQFECFCIFNVVTSKPSPSPTFKLIGEHLLRKKNCGKKKSYSQEYSKSLNHTNGFLKYHGSIF